MKWPELITAMDRKAKQTMAQLEEAKVFELRLTRGDRHRGGDGGDRGATCGSG